MNNITNDELKNLDRTLAGVILPYLKKFKKHVIGYPGSFNEYIDEEDKPYIGNDGSDTWDNILEKMIDGFEKILEDEYFDVDKQYHEDIEESLRLFAKYYSNLWL